MMKVPLEWLKQYVPIRLAPKALAERLTMAGLEVTGIEEVNGQPVLDLEVTPNRADCLSMIGVAREVAALTGQRLKLPQAQGSGLRAQEKSRQSRTPNPEPRTFLQVKIEDRKGCSRYLGRLLENVTIKPSPDWMQQRLAACGIRPINNIVDITNYVLLEYGQPLHAFDFTRLAQGTILVRRAQPNEALTTLDGVARKLSPETLVIADATRAVAVAGVMGGIGSEVTTQTTTVLLESALFDPMTIRRAARKLGIASESSYRFERGVDPLGVEAASDRAARLVVELAGGVDQERVEAGSRAPARSAITLHMGRLNQWLGTQVASPTLRTGLAKLGCRVASSEASSTLRVSPPSFRPDLAHEVDLYEEVARLLGYDRLPATLPVAVVAGAQPEATLNFWRVQSLKCACASLGLTEAITWSLLAESHLTHVGCSATQAVRVANPLSQDHAYLRPTLLIGLLHAVRYNLTQGVSDVKLFEVGGVLPSSEHTEQLRLGMAVTGLWMRDWQAKASCDLFRVKGLLHTLLGHQGEAALDVALAQHAWSEPGHAIELRLRGAAIGVAGQVSRRIAMALDIEQDVWMAELSVERMLAATPISPQPVHAPAAFPPVKRDLSVFVNLRTPFGDLDRAIREVGAPLVNHLELIDRYTGHQVPQGTCGLTVSIEYRDRTRTLTASEVDAVHERIRQTLVERFGAQLR